MAYSINLSLCVYVHRVFCFVFLFLYCYHVGVSKVVYNPIYLHIPAVTLGFHPSYQANALSKAAGNEHARLEARCHLPASALLNLSAGRPR